MNRIKELREEKKIKQLDLAKTLNVSQGTLSNWEREIHDLDNEALFMLSDYFQVSTDYLLGKSENSSPQLLIKPIPSSPFTELDKLPKEEQEKIIEYYNMIVAKCLGSTKEDNL